MSRIIKKILGNEKVMNKYFFNPMCREQWFYMRHDIGMTYLRNKNFPKEERDMLKRSRAFWAWVLHKIHLNNTAILADMICDGEDEHKPMLRKEYYGKQKRMLLKSYMDGVVMDAIYKEQEKNNKLIQSL